jgi:hypothetical protein
MEEEETSRVIIKGKEKKKAPKNVKIKIAPAPKALGVTRIPLAKFLRYGEL